MRSIRRSVASLLAALTTTTRLTRRSRRQEVTRALDSGGFLGASIASWVATSPSLLPRTWWMWAVNIGLSQMYGYASGVVVSRAIQHTAEALGVRVGIIPELRSRARWLGGAALVGITAYSWMRGVLRQREISHLVGREPKNVATAGVGAVGGLGLALGALVSVRAAVGTGRMYRAVLRPYLPARVLGVVSISLTAATVAVLLERLIRGRLLEQAIEKAEAANRLISPEVRRPVSALRSGSRESSQSWASLGASGRRIVAGGAEPSVIAGTIGAPAHEPIRVYAGRSSSRGLPEAVEAVLAELDRTGAWDREVLVLFTGTGTGWLQEWSLSAIEFLTGGDCATASLQYSVYTSALSAVLDRHAPRLAGMLLFRAVRERLDRMPQERRPRLFVAGESLGSYGGHAAFRDPAEMLRGVDGAVWTGTPGFTPIWRTLTRGRRAGSPAIAPVIDHGRHIRFVTTPADLETDFYDGLYLPWEAPRIVYAQHASDPIVWWRPSLLWEAPDWLREKAGRDVTRHMQWFPWITFWQVAADMPLSVTMPGGHGHSYHEEMVPIWAAVLGRDDADVPAIVAAIRAHVDLGKNGG
ncbi:alpha/beta hydrolase [Brachybacterium hainanense]|uniref:Alpha/beta hydrolase n=1 Tax=Brachybacterium hainanense TaxID=1541174 RepID=A0ABV6RE96_9MICO